MKMSVDKLLKEYNLKIGDQLLFTEDVERWRSLRLYEVTRLPNDKVCLVINDGSETKYNIGILFDSEWVHYDSTNYVGMKSCSDFTNCSGCPLNGLRCQDLKGKTLNAKWEAYKKAYPEASSELYTIANKLKEYIK